MRHPLTLAPLLLLLITIARPCSAQAVTATSGDPATMANIRAEYATTQREAPTYRKTVHEVHDFSLEGGELTGFFRGSEPRKLSARLYGETWQATEEFYFADGRPIFIHVVHHRYDEAMSGRMIATIEHRFYLEGDRLIRHVRTQRPETKDDLSFYDPQPSGLLRDARLLAACAAAPTKPFVPECTAPDP